MQADDVRALRQCAATAAVVGVLAVVGGGVFAGGRGVLGAVYGCLTVCVFFLISYFAMRRAAKAGPQAMMPVALISYMVKIVLVALLVAHFRNTTAFSGRTFGLTAVACILAWTGAQARLWMTDRSALTLDPVPAPKAVAPSAAGDR